MSRLRPHLTPDEIWRKYDSMEARLTARLSARMIDLAALRSGMRVLDLATGRGEPAIPAAHRVGSGGYVLGIDVSQDMLQMTQERAHSEGLRNLELRALDAAFFENSSGERFHAVLARWGLMYMNDPVAALLRAREALRPDGLLIAAVLAEPERAPYFTWPRGFLKKYKELPAERPDTAGPFRYADARSLEHDLRRAGFGVQHAEEMDLAVMEVVTVSELVAWVRAIGLDSLLDGLPEEVQLSWEADLIAGAEALRADGVYRLGAVTRIVVGQPR